MKKYPLVLVIAIFLIGCLTTSEIVDQTDEFDKTRTIEKSIALYDLTSQNQLIFRKYFIQGKEFYDLIGRFWMESWGFFKHIDILINNENIALVSHDQSRNVLSSGVIEWVYFRADKNLFERMVSAKQLKIRFLGSKKVKTFELTIEHQSHIQEFLDYIENN